MKFNDLFFDLWININHELAPFVCYLNDILQKTLAHYNFIISPQISLFFLPDDYKTIIFDFIVTIARVAEPKEYITVVLHRKYQDQYNSSFDEKKLMTILKDNIVEGEGEVYEMSIEECPEMYAGKANPREFYKTLHTIKTF